jgi:flagellar basal-body rod protein FlgB
MVGRSNVVDVLDAGLRASLLRQKVIANNIANLDTAGYRRNDVKFEELLAEVLDGSDGINRADLERLETEVYRPMSTPVKRNGNDVDLDQEIGELMKSATRHKAYLRLLNKMYNQMELAMQDGQ